MDGWMCVGYVPGYVCVRGFDRTSRAPKPLATRLHLQATKSPSKGAAMETNDWINKTMEKRDFYLGQVLDKICS
jgi:hypothetical protein